MDAPNANYSNCTHKNTSKTTQPPLVSLQINQKIPGRKGICGHTYSTEPGKIAQIVGRGKCIIVINDG